MENEGFFAGNINSIRPFCPNCVKDNGYHLTMEIEDGEEVAGTAYGHYTCVGCDIKITVGIDIVSDDCRCD